MTKHSIAELAFKLLGVYLLVQLLSTLANFLLPVILRGQGPREILYDLAGPLLFVVGAVLLLTNADWLARKLVGPDESLTEAALRIEDVQEVAFSVAGVMIVARAIGAIFNTTSLSLRPTGGFGEEPPFELVPFLIGLAGPILQLILGVVLFVSARRVTEWIMGARARARNYDVGDEE